MRIALLAAVVASIAATGVSRHLPPRALVDISRIQYSSKFVLDARSDEPSTPSSSTPPAAQPSNTDDANNNPDFPLARSANDEFWFKYVSKGGAIDCAMRGTDESAGHQLLDTRNPPSAASRWLQGVKDTQDWYWWNSPYPFEECDMGGFWGLRTTFIMLGISTVPAPGGSLLCYLLRHNNVYAEREDGSPLEVLEQSYKMEGHLYHATNAKHFFAIDVPAGAIVGIDLEGTDRAAEQLWGWLPAADDLPKLRKISDLYWAYWFALHYGSNISMGKLDKYVVYGVANAQTAQLISRAVKSRGRTQLESWPGQYFSIDTPHALALIGSPIGATVGFLLMQHKRELGRKYVTGVRILLNDLQEANHEHRADLVFYIADVPPEQQPQVEPSPTPSQGQVQADALITSVINNLTSRDLPGFTVEEHILGPHNLLRTHTFIVR